MAVLAAILFYLRGPTVTPVMLCTFAALLDLVDGWVARRWGQISKLGEHLDPLADKILISIIFLALIAFSKCTLLWILVPLILIREWGITWLREAYKRTTGESIPADRLGKWKMIAQSLFGNFFLLWLALMPENSEPSLSYRISLVLALVLILGLSYTSGIRYYLKLRRALKAS
jgi:CDP-diacylglycerol---glycerol-3-phosphate 3-phosphatidyltransferase